MANTWHETPFHVGDRLAGTVFNCGTEVHVQFTERMVFAKSLKRIIVELFEQHGYLTTRRMIDDDLGGLLEKAGFNETWRDSDFVYYMLTDLKKWRNEPCHQQ